MTNYDNFTINDFVENESFTFWVLRQNESDMKIWNEIIANHPNKKKEIQEAKKIVLNLASTASNQTSILDKNKLWASISNKTIKETRKKRSVLIICAITAVIFLFSIKFIFSKTEPKNPTSQNQIASWTTVVNENSTTLRVNLNDGSSVTLEPNSSIQHRIKSTGNKREVILSGDAFFDIARDTTMPFYVYANEAIIRVLGTSFFVNADKEEKDIEVVVKTGKVAVYKDSDVREYRRNKQVKAKPLFVTPNQKVVLNKAEQKMSKRLTSAPSLIKDLNKLDKLKFVNRPLSEIISTLEDAYGISILVSNTELANCRLTTTLTNETLFEKLDIICLSLGLEYKEIDAKIIIEGNCD